jgi:hypothetical protein
MARISRPPDSTAAELSEGGKAHDQEPGIADATLERAKRDIMVKPLN